MTPPSLAQLIGALQKLPRTGGLSYRGLAPSAQAPDGTFITEALTPTSRDPRVATENFTTMRVLAIAGRAGRDLAHLAQNPAEAEVVFLPGSILKPVTTALAHGVQVHVVEELLTDTAAEPGDHSLPTSADALVERITAEITEARYRSEITVTTPGKFVGQVT